MSAGGNRLHLGAGYLCGRCLGVARDAILHIRGCFTFTQFVTAGQGSRALVLSAISADIFHGKHFGAIFGYFTFSIGIGGAIWRLAGRFRLTLLIATWSLL
jgi:hypothetical protein